jgi:hypothetical protein
VRRGGRQLRLRQRHGACVELVGLLLSSEIAWSLCALHSVFACCVLTQVCKPVLLCSLVCMPACLPACLCTLWVLSDCMSLMSHTVWQFQQVCVPQCCIGRLRYTRAAGLLTLAYLSTHLHVHAAAFRLSHSFVCSLASSKAVCLVFLTSEAA